MKKNKYKYVLLIVGGVSIAVAVGVGGFIGGMLVDQYLHRITATAVSATATAMPTEATVSVPATATPVPAATDVPTVTATPSPTATIVPAAATPATDAATSTTCVDKGVYYHESEKWTGIWLQIGAHQNIGARVGFVDQSFGDKWSFVGVNIEDSPCFEVNYCQGPVYGKLTLDGIVIAGSDFWFNNSPNCP